MSGISNIYHGTPPQDVVRRGVEGSLSHTLLHTLQVLSDKEKVFFISLHFYKSISLIGIYPTMQCVMSRTLEDRRIIAAIFLVAVLVSQT